MKEKKKRKNIRKIKRKKGVGVGWEKKKGGEWNLKRRILQLVAQLRAVESKF